MTVSGKLGVDPWEYTLRELLTLLEGYLVTAWDVAFAATGAAIAAAFGGKAIRNPFLRIVDTEISNTPADRKAIQRIMSNVTVYEVAEKKDGKVTLRIPEAKNDPKN